MVCFGRDLRTKSVINVRNGGRLGRVDDVQIDTGELKVLAIVVYGRLRLFGLLGRDDDLIIPWEDIEIVGEDAVLVCLTERRPYAGAAGRQRESWF